jgi:hypothetical protein
MKVKILLIFSVLLNLTLVAFFAINRIKNNQKSINQQLYFGDNVFSTFTFDSINVESTVFLGDSHFGFFKPSESFNKINIFNYGILGNLSESLIESVKMAGKHKPKIVFIEIGINDLLKNRNPSEVVMNINNSVEILKKESSETRIIVCSLLPTSKVKKSSIKKVNAGLLNMCKKRDIVFIDLYSNFLNKTNNYTADSLHLNNVGYDKLKTILKPYL